MNGIAAQLLTLVAHGNAHLDGHDLATDFADRNPSFQFVAQLSFRRDAGAEGAASWTEPDIRAWLEHLRAEGVDRLTVVNRSAPAWPTIDGVALTEAQARAFAGGNTETILATGPDRGEVWWSEWSTGSGVEGRPWIVTYHGQELPPPVPAIGAVPGALLAEVDRRLRDALDACRAFAETEPGLTTWAAYFEAGLDTSALGPAARETHVLPSVGYSPVARQLLGRSMYSDVFGGMGSWNDILADGADAQRRYDEVSDQLYRAMQDGIVAAINSYDPRAAPAPG